MSERWEGFIGWLFLGTGIFVACVLIVIWLVDKQRNRSDSIPAEEASGATAIADEDLVRRFIGPNQDYYINIWKRNPSQVPRGRFVIARSWNWPAALCFSPWALYRKMWLWAFAVPVATAVVTAALPSANSLWAHLVALGLTGWWANAVYLHRAIGKIEKIRSAGVSEAQMLTRLDKAGGVSRVGAWFGGIAYTLIELLSLYVVLRARSNKLGFYSLIAARQFVATRRPSGRFTKTHNGHPAVAIMKCCIRDVLCIRRTSSSDYYFGEVI